MISTRKPKTKTIVGLDIEASSIAATELVLNGSPNVRGYGVAPINSGLFRDGEVHEPGELADAIKELFSVNKLNRNVRVGVANQRVAVRTLTLPKLEDPSELEAAIRFQAADHVPVPLDQAVLDWQVIPPVKPMEHQEGLQVVVVAARRAMVAPVVEAVERAGRRRAGIDL
jgi:type IV pilus assembly protein PilM